MKKRDEILRAALKLFVEQGEQATYMKLIGKEGKCGIGTMYNYFKSKDKLINELYIEIKTKMFTYIQSALDKNAPVKQQFVDTMLRASDFYLNNPLEYKFLEVFSYSPKISKQASEKVNKLVVPILEIFEKGKKEGIIKIIDSYQLLIFTKGAISASIMNNPDINENEKKEFVLMAWDAIKS